jgi:poly(glycerol-phosphate) alpha-glucosyltransferase
MTSAISDYFSSVLQDIKTPDSVVVFTKQQQDHLRARFGDGQYFVIPHAHELVRQNLSIQRDHFKIVMLGRFAEEKQHHLAIEALSRVVEAVPKAHLHLYGYGDKHQVIVDAIEKFKLADHVHLHDFEHDTAPLWQSAGLSLSTSRNEGFGLSIMESLFYGCPVISFDCHYGPAAMIQDGVNGYLIKPQDITDLANRLIQLLTDEVTHNKLLAQTAKSMNDFSFESVANKWRALLLQIGAVAPAQADSTPPTMTSNVL